MFDFPRDENKIREQLKFDAGLERILRAVVAIHGYDWGWFIENISRMRSPIATIQDQENLTSLASMFSTMGPSIEYLNLRGSSLQDQAKKANLN